MFKNYRPFLFLLICTLGIVSCIKTKKDPKGVLTLNPKYLQIDLISSFANCKSPNGDYITKVNSKKDGSLSFYQKFENRDAPFIAEIRSDNTGYVIDESKKVVDTLASLSVEMIRSHDFHRIQTNPKAFYHQIKFDKALESGRELYTAVDRLGNPVKLFFDRTNNQLRNIEFLNMMDTTEVIQIRYKAWEDSDYGKLAKEIEIVQAKKDTFSFHFETIYIN